MTLQLSAYQRLIVALAAHEVFQHLDSDLKQSRANSQRTRCLPTSMPHRIAKNVNERHFRRDEEGHRARVQIQLGCESNQSHQLTL